MPRNTARASRLALAVLACLAVAGAVAGCGAQAGSPPPQGAGAGPVSPAGAGASPTPSPSPSETETPVPTVGGASSEAIDPRCLRQFPAESTSPIHEAQLEGRPDFWPEAPAWAALCWTEWENEYTQVGWYATDEGVSRAEIYRYYEHELMGVGATGRAQTAEGEEFVTGVVPPLHSFWLLSGRDHYRATWSLDGEYAD